MSPWSKTKFETLGEPYHWWLTSDSMKDAAEVIFDAIAHDRRTPSADDLKVRELGFQLAHPLHDRRSVYVLLTGFSLENLLKAEYMRLHGPSLADGKLPREIMAHDLLALSRLVSFEPRAEEEAMLRIASEATVSWGRYPSGLRHDQGGMSPPDCFDLNEFRRAFEAVYWRLTEVITEGWTDS
jgi:hypothetical protein